MLEQDAHTAKSVAPVRANRAVVCQLLHGMEVGGAEVLAARLARRLGERYRFVFACLDEVGTLGESLRCEGYEVSLIGRRGGVDPACIGRLGRWMRQRGVKCIHAHQYTPFFYGACARWIARRVPLVFTEHGRWHPDYRRWKRVLFNRMMLGRRDVVVGVGQSVQQALIDHEGIAPQRVGRIYNGIDLRPYETPSNGVRETMRQSLGVAADEVLVIQVARLDGLKDHATAIRAMAAAVHDVPRLRLALVGEGPLRTDIEQLISQLRLGEVVRLLGRRTDVAELLAAADVSLLTSVSEGIPLTVMEAMAAGLPVVATRVGGVPELVEKEQTGLLCEAGDAACLARALVDLAHDATRRRCLGEAGRRLAHAKFGEDRMLDAYADVYEALLHGQPRAAVPFTTGGDR